MPIIMIFFIYEKTFEKLGHIIFFKKSEATLVFSYFIYKKN